MAVLNQDGRKICSVLFVGRRGSGKTAWTKAISNETSAALLKLAPPQLLHLSHIGRSRISTLRQLDRVSWFVCATSPVTTQEHVCILSSVDISQLQLVNLDGCRFAIALDRLEDAFSTTDKLVRTQRSQGCRPYLCSTMYYVHEVANLTYMKWRISARTHCNYTRIQVTASLEKNIESLLGIVRRSCRKQVKHAPLLIGMSRGQIAQVERQFDLVVKLSEPTRRARFGTRIPIK